jgi:hypothetical protein
MTTNAMAFGPDLLAMNAKLSASRVRARGWSCGNVCLVLEVIFNPIWFFWFFMVFSNPFYSFLVLSGLFQFLPCQNILMPIVIAVVDPTTSRQFLTLMLPPPQQQQQQNSGTSGTTHSSSSIQCVTLSLMLVKSLVEEFSHRGANIEVVCSHNINIKIWTAEADFLVSLVLMRYSLQNFNHETHDHVTSY